VPQFTVYRNENPRSKTHFPFLVDVQCDLLEALQMCVVVRLSKAAALTKKPVTHLTPILDFEGEKFILVTPQLAGVARSDLGPVAGSLAGQRHAIIAAVDFLLSGF
jgi:toxin CcdB